MLSLQSFDTLMQKNIGLTHIDSAPRWSQYLKFIWQNLDNKSLPWHILFSSFQKQNGESYFESASLCVKTAELVTGSEVSFGSTCWHCIISLDSHKVFQQWYLCFTIVKCQLLNTDKYRDCTWEKSDFRFNLWPFNLSKYTFLTLPTLKW